MASTFCAVIRGAARPQRTFGLRELRAVNVVEHLDLATLGSVSTVAVALVSAVALALLGGV